MTTRGTKQEDCDIPKAVVSRSRRGEGVRVILIHRVSWRTDIWKVRGSKIFFSGFPELRSARKGCRLWVCSAGGWLGIFLGCGTEERSGLPLSSWPPASSQIVYHIPRWSEGQQDGSVGKDTCCKDWRLVFDPRDPHGGRKEHMYAGTGTSPFPK